MTSSVPARLAVVGAALLVLGACGFRLPWRDEPPPCPRVQVLSDSGQLVRYRPGEGRDATDVATVAELAQLDWSCSYRTGGDAPHVEVDLVLDMRVRPGPAATAPQVTLPYFVAAVDGFRNVIDKQIFAVTVDVPPDIDRVRLPAPERVAVRLPLDRGTAGWEYTVVVGFQMTPEELEDALRRRR